MLRNTLIGFTALLTLAGTAHAEDGSSGNLFEGPATLLVAAGAAANIAAPAFGIYDLTTAQPTTSNVYGAVEIGAGVTAGAFNIALLSNLGSDCDCAGAAVALVGLTAIDVSVALHGIVTIVREEKATDPLAFSVGRARITPTATTGMTGFGLRGTF